jgi:hypothetical protein
MHELFYCIIVILLIASNLFTICYYQKQINVLIDKAMSRSYPEYVQTKTLEQSERFPNIGTQEKPQIDDDSVLDELNRIIS